MCDYVASPEVIIGTEVMLLDKRGIRTKYIFSILSVRACSNKYHILLLLLLLGCFIYECTSICWLLAGIDVHNKSEAILNQNEYSWCLPLLWAVERVSRKGERSLGTPLICVRWNN